jgi:hypothetical protein
VSASGAARRRRPVLIGLGLAAAYAVVCLTTLRVTGHDVRPLFEGVGPSSPYRWVNPPKEFAPGNVKPRASSTDVELLTNGSKAAGLLSSDSQLVINLNASSVPPKAGDNRVTIKFVPLDAATLGKLTPPMRPDGNAYRVEMAYKPSGTPVTALTTTGDVLLIVPEPADTILFSTDGQTWKKLDSRHESGSGAESATFASPGYYLAGTSQPPPSPVAKSSRGYGTVVVVAAVGLLAIVLAWTPYMRQRLRSRRSTGKRSSRAGPKPRSRPGR